MKRPSRSFLFLVAAFIGGTVTYATIGIHPTILGQDARAWWFGAPAPVASSCVHATASTSDFAESASVADDADVPLTDDLLTEKNPSFDPTLVDRRAFEAWQVNTSGAVVRVDSSSYYDGADGTQSVRPNYATALRQTGSAMVPSVNLIDGKAKQFDDGLYAAIDRAYYSGDPVLGPTILGHRALLERMLARVKSESPAADYLAAGLSLDTAHPPAVPLSSRARELALRFQADEIQSRPIGFYTWDSTLGDCFRVLRFFGQPITDQSIVADLAQTLWDDGDLRDRYRQATLFYARLTNPWDGSSLLDFVVDSPPVLTASTRVALFPLATSREVELFRRVFPNGPPANAQLMRAFVTAVRTGTIDLAPTPASGWYDYQAFALEPLLLADRGEGADHLLLTRAYKKRLLSAFEALLTKRRETHARQLAIAGGAEKVQPARSPITPRLRVEPNPSYYLRTARSYAFLAQVLAATFGSAQLDAIHGLRQSGPRPEPLGPELRSIRDLFLGLALLSSEDIGHRLGLTDEEAGRAPIAEAAALAWLDRIKADPESDPDLLADTRVAVPISYDPLTRQVRLWATIGVSIAGLESHYARGPRVRPLAGGDWQPVPPEELKSSHQWIAVDEFAEVVLDGGRVLTRTELRSICDTHKTIIAIRAALHALK